MPKIEVDFMPKPALEVEAAFPLEAVVKIRHLQIELEKICCNRIKKLAVKAKQDEKLEMSRIYYKAWASRMLNLRRLQKQQEQEQKAIIKQTARLEKARAKSITKPEAKLEAALNKLIYQLEKNKAITSVNNNVSELRQVC